MENNSVEQKQDILYNESEVKFPVSDITEFSVKNEETQESLFEITGYALKVQFNREKIRSISDVENLLDGIKDLFRDLIMQELLSKDNSEDTK